MSKPTPTPAKVHAESVPWGFVEGGNRKLRVRRLITRGSHGSEMTTGIAELDAGVETEWFSFMPERPGGSGELWFGPCWETYYGIRGQLTLYWNDGNGREGTIEFGPEEAVFLAPGYRYKLANHGSASARVVYSLYPSHV